VHCVVRPSAVAQHLMLLNWHCCGYYNLIIDMLCVNNGYMSLVLMVTGPTGHWSKMPVMAETAVRWLLSWPSHGGLGGHSHFGQWPTDILPPVVRRFSLIRLFCRRETIYSTGIEQQMHLKSWCFTNIFIIKH